MLTVSACSVAQRYRRTSATSSVDFTWAVAGNSIPVLRARDLTLLLSFSLPGIIFSCNYWQGLFLSSLSLFHIILFTGNPSFLHDFKILKTKAQESCWLVLLMFFFSPSWQLPGGRKAWDLLFQELWKKRKKKMWLDKKKKSFPNYI